MSDSLIEFQTLRNELHALYRQVLNELHETQGELLATNTWVHALVATHPDLAGLRAIALKLTTQVAARDPVMAPSVQEGFDGANATLHFSLQENAKTRTLKL